MLGGSTLGSVALGGQLNNETELDAVTPDVVELIEKQKRVPGQSMKKIYHGRAQEFLTKTESETIVEMSDRRFTKTPTGWKSSKRA
jgi:hypothetical protein